MNQQDTDQNTFRAETAISEGMDKKKSMLHRHRPAGREEHDGRITVFRFVDWLRFTTYPL